MAAVAVLGILMALATYGLRYMGTARMNNAVFDVAALTNAAQLRAISRGAPHYIFVHQVSRATDPQLGRVRVLLIERPDVPSISPAAWQALDLTDGPARALQFTGPTGPTDAMIRDRIELGTTWAEPGNTRPTSGVSVLGFLDLDSPRIHNSLPPPFTAISMNTGTQANPLDLPSLDLLVGCNFCIKSQDDETYGVLRFNPDGTMEVLTGNARTGGVIAFAPSTREERDFAPRLLTISAPAGAVVIF